MSDPMLPNQRADFSAIVDRPPLKLPAARASSSGPSSISKSGTSRARWRVRCLSAPTGQPLLPDVPNWSWHEYGMRVGAWRFFDLYKRHNIKPTLSINARVCEDYPRVAQEAKDLGWEFMGHAYDQGPIHKVEDQRGMIFKSMDIIENFTGTRPVGWLGPGLTQTLDDPGQPRRSRREVYRRLGLTTTSRRSFAPRRAAGHAALHGRTERHPDDDRAAPRERSSLQALRRKLRPPLRRERRRARNSCRSRSTPTSAASPSASRRWKRSTITSPSSMACCTGMARKFSTGTTKTANVKFGAAGMSIAQRAFRPSTRPPSRSSAAAYFRSAASIASDAITSTIFAR